MTANRNGFPTGRLVGIRNGVTSIASALAKSSTEEYSPEQASSYEVSVPQVSAQLVQSHIRTRRLRDRYFDESLFADPAWDMMLDLFVAELLCQRVSVSSLCVGAAVPATTAIRWINALVQKGLFIRRDDPLDGRRVFVELSPDASMALKRYFAELTSDTEAC